MNDDVFKDVDSAKAYYTKVKKIAFNPATDAKKTDQLIADLKTVGKFLEAKGVTRKQLNKL